MIRAAGLPVLALPSDAWGVPHSVLVAMDFTASSEHAARAALELLGDEGTLYIAHVTPRLAIPQGDSRTWDEITTGAVIPKLEALVRRLDPSPGIRVEYVLLHGDPAHELMAFAEQIRHRHDRCRDARALGAGAADAGQRVDEAGAYAKCWVLVAPPHRDAPNPDDRREAPNDWS